MGSCGESRVAEFENVNSIKSSPFEKPVQNVHFALYYICVDIEIIIVYK